MDDPGISVEFPIAPHALHLGGELSHVLRRSHGVVLSVKDEHPPLRTGGERLSQLEQTVKADRAPQRQTHSRHQQRARTPKTISNNGHTSGIDPVQAGHGLQRRRQSSPKLGRVLGQLAHERRALFLVCASTAHAVDIDGGSDVPELCKGVSLALLESRTPPPSVRDQNCGAQPVGGLGSDDVSVEEVVADLIRVHVGSHAPIVLPVERHVYPERHSAVRSGRRSSMRVTLVLFAVGMAAACDDDVIRQLPPAQLQVDVLPQQAAAQVDILWVIDNSESMVDEQDALAQNFDRFITGLTTCQGTGVEDDVCDFDTKTCRSSGESCNPPDYHIGVISTDTRSDFDSGRLRRVGVCTTAAGASPNGNLFRYCLGVDSDCVHDAADPSSDPANGTCDMSQSLSFVTATTPGAASAFARAVRVGTAGNVRETGIEAAAAALGRDTDRNTGQFIPAPSENDGFLRANASLFVIFVSDEDDSSFGEPAYFYRAFETIKGAGNEGLVSISAIVGDPDADGETGTLPGGCEVPAPMLDEPPLSTAAAGTRYVALAMYTRGLSPEFRACDLRRLGCGDNQTCQVPVEDLPGVCVPAGTCASDADCGTFSCAGGGCLACVEGQCTALPESFLELLEQNGVFGSICNPDYGNVLRALGFEAAGLSRKFELTLDPNCVGEAVKCCAADIADDQCSVEAVMCVRVDGQPVPNSRADGWIFDAGSRAVFFDGRFVPPPQSEVSISYRPIAQGNLAACLDRLE